MYTRRHLGKLGLALLAPDVLAKLVNRVSGVWIGLQGWSFRDRSLDAAIEATKEVGLGSWELGFNHLEPAGVSRQELRKWRETVPLEEFRNVRRKFDANGMVITGYSYGFRKDYSEQEIARGFEMAGALGVKVLTTTTVVSMAPELDRHAARAKIRVGLHNHSRIQPDEVATPDDFAKALDGASPYMGINLDVGHFCAAGFDAVPFIQQHHQRIWSLHLKDRKKNQGADCLFGEGDTPVREILLLLKKDKFDIPSMIEWEPKEGDKVAAIRQCLDYCRKVLG
jgi:sugar phosphate isomerase/epimerase